MSVVEIHLPNGWCTSVKTSHNTTVQNLLDVVARKFCGRGIDGSDAKHLSACFLFNGKTQWLQKNELIAKYLIFDQGSSTESTNRLKLDVHVRFFPVNLSELSQQVLRLLFEQVFKVYINLNERIGTEMASQPDMMLLLELGCLQMRRVLGDCPPEAVYSKANMRYLEKQVGFSQFFPQILLSRYSPAKLSFRRLIRSNLRQFASMSADDCTLKFLELLNKNYVFTDETFGHLTLGSSSTDGPEQTIQRIITLRIGPTLGLACVRSTGSICELASFAQLESAEIVLPPADKKDGRPQLRIKTLDGDSLTLSCRDASQASAIVSLLDGYTRLFCNGRSLLPLSKNKTVSINVKNSEQGSASSGVSSNAALDDNDEDVVTFEVVPFQQHQQSKVQQADRTDAVSSGFATIRKHPRNNSTSAASNTTYSPNRLARSRSNSDLRAPNHRSSFGIKSNAQTQTGSNQAENGNEVTDMNTETVDEITRLRNAATAAWLARDRTPDSTPPQLSFTVLDSPMLNSKSHHQDGIGNGVPGALSYATIRRHPSANVGSNGSSNHTTPSNNGSNSLPNKMNVVGWKHASPVDDYIELFEPDVEIDRNRLEIGLLIGEGQFGDVFEGEYRPNGKDGSCIAVAVKMCKSGSDEALGDFLEEACLFRQLAHPYIIALVGVSTSTDPLLILTELAPLGPLRDFLQKERDRLQLNLIDLLTYSAQTASALAYLHSRRLVHRDIAARNVLVFSRELGKLADFGLARRLPPDAETYTATGGRLPVKWLAPESVNFRKFSRATDVWMLGVFMWEVTTFGSRPWQNVRNADYPMLLAVGARLPRPEPQGAGYGNVLTCPPSLYSLMLSCWADQPSDRPGCDQIFSHLLAIREEALAYQKQPHNQILYAPPLPPPKPPILDPQSPPKSSSSSLALEQATLWLLDSVATLAPSGRPLSPTLGCSVVANGNNELSMHSRVSDTRPPLGAFIQQRYQNRPTMTASSGPSSTGKQYIVPVVQLTSNGNPIKVGIQNSAQNNSNNSFNMTSPIEAMSNSAESENDTQLYDQTLNVVRCVFTLNKELERVGVSENPPTLNRILDLASAVCTAGRNLLTVASNVPNTNSLSKHNNPSESLPLLRANLGAHIRSVLAALRPISALPQTALPPPPSCRQLAEAAAGVAVAARLLLARSMSENAQVPPASVTGSHLQVGEVGRSSKQISSHN